MPTTKSSSTTSVTPSAPSAVENFLLHLASVSFQDTFNALSEGAGVVSFGSASAPTLSPGLLALVKQIQEQTGATARRNVTEGFGDIQDQIAADLANRGSLNTSAYGERQLQLGRTLGNRLADINAQGQTTAANQAFSGAFQQQGNQIQLLSMLNSLRLAASNPALLQQLMNFRLGTATQSKASRTTTPFDPTALLGFAGQAVAPFATEGAKSLFGTNGNS